HLLVHLPSFLLWFSSGTAIYTLSLHDALPICQENITNESFSDNLPAANLHWLMGDRSGKSIVVESTSTSLHIYDNSVNTLTNDPDRKSTRLNSSHVSISYAVFCLKKKTKTTQK